MLVAMMLTAALTGLHDSAVVLVIGSPARDDPPSNKPKSQSKGSSARASPATVAAGGDTCGADDCADRRNLEKNDAISRPSELDGWLSCTRSEACHQLWH